MNGWLKSELTETKTLKKAKLYPKTLSLQSFGRMEEKDNQGVRGIYFRVDDLGKVNYDINVINQSFYVLNIHKFVQNKIFGNEKHKVSVTLRML